MKKVAALALCIVLLLSLAACGSSDVFKGTWSCEDKDYGTVTWSFNGNGKCTFENAFFNSEGTYTITDSTVSIKLDIWDNAIVYDFTAAESNLKLTATDGLAPDYDLTKK